ncbi:MAG TPA: hypothetical protein VLV76_26435 [Candidatus Acidoferrum sp.]|nr:hypothetical protein [Candidatus Acidoferrum sp.]
MSIAVRPAAPADLPASRWPAAAAGSSWNTLEGRPDRGFGRRGRRTVIVHLHPAEEGDESAQSGVPAGPLLR